MTRSTVATRVVFAVVALAVFLVPRSASAIPQEEYVEGFGTVTWSFPGAPEEQRQIQCSPSGNDDCDTLLWVLSEATFADRSACVTDRRSTGTARIVAELDGHAFDLSFDRANNCDRWLWDSFFAEALPIPPHLTALDLSTQFNRDFIAELFVDGEAVEGEALLGLPLLTGSFHGPQHRFRLGFCGLTSMSPIRIDGEGRWENPRTPYSAPECSADALGARAPHLQEMFTASTLDVEVTPDSVSLAVGNIELRLHPIPADNSYPTLADVSYDPTTRTVRWAATDDQESTLRACVTINDSETTCELSQGFTSMEVASEPVVLVSVRVGVIDEYGRSRSSLIEFVEGVPVPAPDFNSVATEVFTDEPRGLRGAARLGALSLILISGGLFVRRMRRAPSST